MVYLYIFSVRATFLKFVFFKSRSDLKNEKQEKMRKEKSKRKTVVSLRAGPLRPAIYDFSNVFWIYKHFMMYLYIFSVRATFLKFVFFWKFQSDLKNEKQEKMRKEKSKEKQGRHYGPAHYGLLEPWSPVQKRGEKGCIYFIVF